ncbi:MAG: lysoplasmalogenase [Candidatus Thorarchaeota archaeon]|jgi:uncharacterized membrane protein YhhN
MSEGYIKTPLDVLRVIVILGILGSIVLLVATDSTIPYHFLTTSVVLVFLALLNLADSRIRRNAHWARYTILLFFGMLLGSVGDFLMAGIIYLTPVPLINGVIAFGIGHLFYLAALRDRSPLVLRGKSFEEESSRLILRNVVIWLTSLVLVVILFYVTVYNPSDIVISYGVLGYGILLITVVSMSLAKWFDEFPLAFVLAMFLGLLLFFISDWIIGIRALRDPAFLTNTVDGFTYLLGQLLIHLSPMIGSKQT